MKVTTYSALPLAPVGTPGLDHGFVRMERHVRGIHGGTILSSDWVGAGDLGCGPVIARGYPAAATGVRSMRTFHARASAGRASCRRHDVPPGAGHPSPMVTVRRWSPFADGHRSLSSSAIGRPVRARHAHATEPDRADRRTGPAQLPISDCRHGLPSVAAGGSIHVRSFCPAWTCRARDRTHPGRVPLRIRRTGRPARAATSKGPFHERASTSGPCSASVAAPMGGACRCGGDSGVRGCRGGSGQHRSRSRGQ